MKLKEIIDSIDKSNPHHYVDLIELLEYFKYFDYVDCEEDGRLKGYDLFVWLCTDSDVGLKAYFLDDEFVYLTKQEGRKCRTDFLWESSEAVKKVKDYVEELRKEIPEEDYFALLDMEEEMEPYGDISFTGQIMGYSKVLYKGTLCDIVCKKESSITCQEITILHDGEKKKVHLSECKFQFNLKEN